MLANRRAEWDCTQYDGNNRRTVKKTYASGTLDETRHFYYSLSWQVLEETVEVAGDDDQPVAQYVWGTRYIDDLILRDRDTSDPFNGTLDERLYALQDANFNVVALLEEAGTWEVKERFTYTAYGQHTAYDDDFTSYTGTDYKWSDLYTGQMLDDETGLYQYRHRYYHPQLGRFIRRDPIGHGAGSHLYAYTSANPVVRADPLGLAQKTFTINGSFWDAEWNVATTGQSNDHLLGRWNRKVIASCDGSGELQITFHAPAMFDDEVGMNTAFTGSVTYASDHTQGTVTVGSGFTWNGSDPDFWTDAGIILSMAGAGGTYGGVGGCGSPATPGTITVGMVIGAVVGGTIVISAHLWGEEPMGSSANIEMDIVCVKCPEELAYRNDNLATEWTPVWGTRDEPGEYFRSVRVTGVQQFGQAYQDFRLGGWRYYPHDGGFLPGQVREGAAPFCASFDAANYGVRRWLLDWIHL